MRVSFLLPLPAVCLVAIATGIVRSSDSPSTNPTFPPIGDPKSLPNAHRVTPKILSGAQPEGDAGFKQLAEMGVKTIVSVDGAPPDVEAAKKYGLRYVHLPITYGGVTQEEGKRIAKALEELPGPIYVHCHHGQHRSAAAVAVACVMGGQLKPEQAESVLQTFGTGVDFKGLWRDARNARPLDPKTLDAVKVDYVERAKIPAVAEAMVDIDHALDVLKGMQKAGWQAGDPADAALQLREKLHEVGRTDDAVQRRPDDYKVKLAAAESAVQSLEDARRARKPASPKEFAPAQFDARLKAVSQSCTACHNTYRN